MKIIVAVCVFNRFENIKKWVNAWKQRTHGTDYDILGITSELVIIHNWNGDDRISQLIMRHNIEDNAGINYIRRENIGFDMGCVQDIFKERLQDFPNDWDYLLWCADDTIPVAKDFIQQYLDTILKENCGIACMKISPHQTLHVRTSGWMVSKETSKKIVFPADPITTKWECYLLEHKGGNMTLINQIRTMGLDVRQVAPDSRAPLWDSGYWRRLNRGQEYYDTFGGQKKSNDKIVFLCTIYEQYPQIISALICQTYDNWELQLMHDGPMPADLHKTEIRDERIKWIEMKERCGNYGHPMRKFALENLDAISDADYVVITNADNYYVPTFCEKMLAGFKKKHTAVAVYCDSMVHSYKAHQIIPVKFEKGYIDCGGVMVKREVAQEVGWRDTESHSADWTYFSDIAARYNHKSFIPVKGCLLIHN